MWWSNAQKLGLQFRYACYFHGRNVYVWCSVDDMVVAAVISLQDPVGSDADDICTWIEVTCCLSDTTAHQLISHDDKIDQQDNKHNH